MKYLIQFLSWYWQRRLKNVRCKSGAKPEITAVLYGPLLRLNGFVGTLYSSEHTWDRNGNLIDNPNNTYTLVFPIHFKLHNMKKLLILIITLVICASCVPSLVTAYMQPQQNGTGFIFLEDSKPGKTYDLVINDSVVKSRVGNGRQLGFGYYPFETRFEIRQRR